MIISLRGTSGSGKSTLVRKITALCEGGGVPHHVDGRRKAYYTTHDRPDNKTLAVIGHYEIHNGGVDTLKTIDEAYTLARKLDHDGCDVLMEGKCMSDGQKWALETWRDGFDFRVAHLNTPVRLCVSGVRERGHSIAEHSIQRTYDKVARDVAEFQEAGMPHVASGSRADIYAKVREWLGL